jgi:hypothetical protein
LQSNHPRVVGYDSDGLRMVSQDCIKFPTHGFSFAN